MKFTSLFERKEKLINLEKAISRFKEYDLVGTFGKSDEEQRDLLVARFHLDPILVRTLIAEVDEQICKAYAIQSDEGKAKIRNWIDKRIDETNRDINNLPSIEYPSKRTRVVQELITRIEMFEDYQSKFRNKQR